MDSDACQLACLATELRLACLVHAGCADAAAAPHVTAALQGLFTLLDQAGLVVMRRLSTGGGHSSPGRTSAAAAAAGDQQEASAYLAWLLEAVQCGVAYVCGTGAQQVRRGGSTCTLLQTATHVSPRSAVCTCPALDAMV
jgi:diaminopimelate decarboxylase